jgi:hypothetical protein
MCCTVVPTSFYETIPFKLSHGLWKLASTRTRGLWTPAYTPTDRLTSWGVLYHPCTVPVYKLLLPDNKPVLSYLLLRLLPQVYITVLMPLSPHSIQKMKNVPFISKSIYTPNMPSNRSAGQELRGVKSDIN